jgi:hypothetical protein
MWLPLVKHSVLLTILYERQSIIGNRYLLGLDVMDQGGLAAVVQSNDQDPCLLPNEPEGLCNHLKQPHSIQILTQLSPIPPISPITRFPNPIGAF